jgi:hypothetical protein
MRHALLRGLLALSAISLTPCARASEALTANKAADEPNSGRLQDHVLELTFGNAQLFFTQSMLTPSGEIQDKIIPVTAALIMAEWLAHPRLSVLTLVALPLEAQSTVVDGEVREEYVAPSAAAGARFSVFSFDVFRESVLEVQAAAMVGRTVGSLSGDRFYPLVAGRLHFHTRSGFTLYLGNGYAFAEGTHSVLYGIGHRF